MTAQLPPAGSPGSPPGRVGRGVNAAAAPHASSLQARFPNVTFLGDVARIFVSETVVFEGAATVVGPASITSMRVPISIGVGARIERSTFAVSPSEDGPLTIGACALLADSRLEDSSVETGALVDNSRLSDSIIGRLAVVTGSTLVNCKVSPKAVLSQAEVHGDWRNPTAIGAQGAVSVGAGAVFIAGDSRGDITTGRNAAARGRTAVAQGRGSVAVGTGAVFIGGTVHAGGSVNTGDVVVVNGTQVAADLAVLTRDFVGRSGKP